MGIVAATMKPITFKDLKAPMKVMVDVEHPITKAFLERLPKVPDKDLPLLLKHLHDGPDNADTRSWIQLVEAEIAFRKDESHELFSVIKMYFEGRR